MPVTERLAFRNGELDSSELRAAINELGMKVSEKNLRALIVHLKGSYAHGVSFDGFRSAAPRRPARPRPPAPVCAAERLPPPPTLPPPPPPLVLSGHAASLLPY